MVFVSFWERVKGGALGVLTLFEMRCRMKKSIEQWVRRWTEEFLADKEQELVDVEFVKEGSSFILRVFIDKEEGVTLEDCSFVSRYLSKKLDEEDPISVAYSLEVSSPGVERPLKKRGDFERFSGKKVWIKTYCAREGKKEFEGVLKGLQNDQVLLDVGGDVKTFSLEDIAKARLTLS